MIMKTSSRFDRINKLNRDYSYWQILSLVCTPEITRDSQHCWTSNVRSCCDRFHVASLSCYNEIMMTVGGALLAVF